MKKTILLIILALSLSSCFMVTNSMRRFEGRHVTSLYAEWGYPAEVYDDGGGGRVLVYTEPRGTYYCPPSLSGETSRRGVLIRYAPEVIASYEARRVFWVDKNGIVYKWLWKGL